MSEAIGSGPARRKDALPEWAPRLGQLALGAALGTVPSLVIAVGPPLHASVGLATLQQMIAWLCFVATVIGAIICLGAPRRRWLGYGLLAIVLLTSVLGSYWPLPHPSM